VPIIFFFMITAFLFGTRTLVSRSRQIHWARLYTRAFCA
jgi:hypothetical protein